MTVQKHPSEIAREALMRLAASHLAPTPANYQACYNEIANLPNVAPFPDQPLRKIAMTLTARNAVQEQQLKRLDQAIARRSWHGVQGALTAFIAAAKDEKAVASDVEQVLSPEFSTRLARFIESVLPALGNENEGVTGMLGALLQALRQPPVDVSVIQEMLGNYSHHALFAAEEQAEIKDSLLKLLHLIIQNIGELSLDDSWLKGQVDGLLAVVAPPLTLRHLDEMERRLRDVMVKQSEAKLRSVEAQEEMRQMLAAFIERLASMNESSTTFQGKIEASARDIEQIRKVEDLAPLLADVIAATRSMAEETAQSRELLQTLQVKVLATEAELVQLHLELDSASALARHDPLTDALNRKGLDEALTREIASMRRKESPLSVCLLDIDNFKKLNDRLGHEAGDNALVHLANVARDSMRPTDTLARYGGEEFVILMPDTPMESGIEAMTRLQRELTRAFFLSGNEKVLITFSAGVAQLAADESGADAIRRADRAMYLAKRAGKNRVMGA
ncbi:sensor domain-containing diguanylate cyclase [Dechloromonas sp. A34]|uniref:GGDEF domain-containing protein n=1 Tax=Dechloromonas sp. A34 TaxID=447588 RepID=UPI002248F551|nr:GGDEF domain-containing protein [Dechloromonas sp. A34]